MVIPLKENNKTRVIISGDTFLKVHENRNEYFWNKATSMMLDDSNSRSFSNPGSLFYRGVKVGGTMKETDYSYNIVDTKLELSEDRTLTSWGEYQFNSALVDLITRSKDEDLIEEFVCSKDETRLETLTIHLPNSSTDSVLNKVIQRIYATQPERLQDHLIDQMRRRMGKGESYSSIPLTPLDIIERDKALALIEPLGLDLEKVKIIWKVDLGESVLGCAIRNEVYIGKRCFDDGAKVIAATFIEEYIHAVDKIGDYTRTFQDRVLRMLVNVLAEKSADDYQPNSEISF